MAREDKVSAVAELTERFQTSDGAVLTEYRGLTVSQLADLRAAGYETYDFRNPEPGNTGFRWSEIDPAWESWTVEQYRDALHTDIAHDGYGLDWAAMVRSDTGVLLLPSGRSAHLEAGYFVGAGKPLYALILADRVEPELMLHMADGIATSTGELLLMLEHGR